MSRRALVLITLAACADPPADVGGGCEEVAVRAVSDGIAEGDACRSWLDQTRGRVGAQSLIGSFTVVSRRTRDGLGFVVSAAHTQGTGAFGAENTEVAASLVTPANDGTLSFKLPPADGALRFDELTPHYRIAHDAIPADQNNRALTAIHPRHDYFVTLVDRQRLPDSADPFPVPGARDDASVPLYDPDAVTTSNMPWAPAVAGEHALLLGFPQAGPETGAFSVGTILDDAEATAAIAELRAAGDEEGNIAYDPEAELLVATRALPGMSGGGVFDERGRFLGTMVRVSTAESAPSIVRVVRFSYVEARLRTMLAELGATERAAVSPFLDAAFTEN